MMMNKRLIVAGIFVLLVSPFQVGITSIAAQTSFGRRVANSGIPFRLKPSLDEGIRRFTEAQATGRWDEVAKMLGRFRGGSRGTLYSPEHKECLLSQVKAMPMTSFVTEQIMFSTEILSTPAAKRWWFLMGVAKYKTSKSTIKSPSQITVYRDRGEWYFTPPNYDDDWVRDRVTEADFLVDRSANIVLELDPACPVEIHDLSVAMDREFLSLRKLNFTLRNKTNKKIVGYGLRLGSVGDHCFGFMQGSPLTIESHGTARASEVTYSAYVYYCEGETKKRLVIDEVNFADRSSWTDPRFRRKRIPKDCLF